MQEGDGWRGGQRVCADSQAHIWAAGTFSCTGVSAEGVQLETLSGGLGSHGDGGR